MTSRSPAFPILAAAFLLAGCLYSNVVTPLSTDMNKTTMGTKEGRASTHSVLWLVSWGDAGLPPQPRTAPDHGQPHGRGNPEHPFRSLHERNHHRLRRLTRIRGAGKTPRRPCLCPGPAPLRLWKPGDSLHLSKLRAPVHPHGTTPVPPSGRRGRCPNGCRERQHETVPVPICLDPMGRQRHRGDRQKGGIETIHYADLETRSYILGLWTRHTVHVHGTAANPPAASPPACDDVGM